MNKDLLSGPDLTNQIVGVLTRFREEEIGIMADIQSMYYQVFIPKDQRSFTRFLWWENGDTNQIPTDYEMKVHVFGATSSASCANYALRRTATDYGKDFEKDIVNTMHQNFYVDDMLKSKPNVESAIKFIANIKQLCQHGGFNLTKFAVNNSAVLETIPKGDRAPAINTAVLTPGESKLTDRALGVLWDMQRDAFKFVINLNERPPTRRGLLSMVSSIYDPLGFISPFLLKGKGVVQHLCAMKLGWDDPIPDETLSEWLSWKEKLTHLNKVLIDRCFKPPMFGKVMDYSIHHFSDASEVGYGQASYLRVVNTLGEIHCSLIIGKSRVVPIKFFSIPRLELTAAVLSARMSKLVSKELQLTNVRHIFWTDSQVVLSYLKSTSKRFKTFVANRIEVVRTLTNIEDWRYVKSSDNPADLASRGITVNKKEHYDMWFQGPRFLWSLEDQWPKSTQPHQFKLIMKIQKSRKLRSTWFTRKKTYMST